ncbi:GtrA family protein [Pseudescherichia sp.]|uniref:GtrA family protein n=1 Tax=Pseudescherichia sp. TaxID=2055881 RepID=UPI0028A106C9|nr:GtrA family protein [Pseudescherichia sp.]
MLNIFVKYATVGIFNTLIHWLVFAACFYITHSNQSVANFTGFFVAVSFSFFANARVTFKSSTTTLRYLLYVIFMGIMSAAVGKVADLFFLPPILTLIFFSAISLVCGFIFSKYIVFRDAK